MEKEKDKNHKNKKYLTFCFLCDNIQKKCFFIGETIMRLTMVILILICFLSLNATESVCGKNFNECRIKCSTSSETDSKCVLKCYNDYTDCVEKEYAR